MSGKNPFFNNYYYNQEQGLYDDLLNESVGIAGENCYYLPRRINNLDSVYNADDISSFNKAYETCLYIESFEGFQGEGSVQSKWNLEIRDQLIFMMTTRMFQDDIGQYESFIRAREGDLIYFPLNKKCFEIRYVEDKPYFYQLGRLPSYRLHCELYEYSDERFTTGIPEIDSIQKRLSTNVYDYALIDDNGDMLVDDEGIVLTSDKYDLDVIDPLQDNEEIQKRSDEILDFTELNPWSEKTY